MNRFEAIIQQVQSRGERITLQRRLVIEALCSDQNHKSVTGIQRAIQGVTPGQLLSETTIYRILQWLKGLNLVSQTDMGGAGIVYQLIAKPHHHLICLNCGLVVELDDRYLAALRDQLMADCGFVARIEHMAIYGLCRDCAAEQNKAARPVRPSGSF